MTKGPATEHLVPGKGLYRYNPMGSHLLYRGTRLIETIIKGFGTCLARSAGKPQSLAESITLCLCSSLFAERNIQLGLSSEMRPVFVCMLSYALVVKGLGVHTFAPC